MNKTLRNFISGKSFLWTTGTIAALTALYFLLGYFAVDPLAKRLLPWIAENKFASRIDVERVAFDPLRLTLTVKEFRLSRKDGSPLAGFGRLHVDLEAGGLFRRAWHLRDIRITAPSAQFDIDKDGKLNWSELIAKLNEDKEPDDGKLPRVVIDHILIEQGSLKYAEHNRTVPFKTEFTPLALELDGFSTLPQDRGDYLIAARMPDQGAVLRWKGNFGANPLSSAGSVDVSGINLTKLAQVIRKETLPIAVTDGELGATLHYTFSMVNVPGKPEPKPQAILSQVSLVMAHLAAQLNPDTRIALGEARAQLPVLDLALHQGGRMVIQDLDIKANKIDLQRKSERLLALEELGIEGITYAVANKRLDIANILLREGNIRAKREKDGTFDWQRVGPPPADAPAAPPAQSDNQPFSYNIGKIAFQQWRVEVQDQTFVNPVRLGIENIDLALSAKDAGDGIAIEGLEAGLAKLTLHSMLYPDPVASLTDIDFSEGKILVKDRTAHLPALTLSGLQTQVLVDAKKVINWLAILETVPPSASVASADSSTPAPPWNIALDAIRLENASVHINDQGSGTPVALDLQNGALELRDTSLDLAKAMPLKAGFKIKQGGSFNVNGKLALAPLKGDLNLKLEGLPLAPFSPYLNQHALLKLTGGQAGVQGKLTLKPGKALSGQFNGGFAIRDLAINEEIDNRPFLSWKSLSSNSLRLSLGPNRLHMDELRAEHPVGRIIIFEDRSMNIQRILRPSGNSSIKTPTTASTRQDPEAPFPVSLDRFSIAEGDLEFADLSLVPQFGAQVHTLTGVINGLSTEPSSAAQVELDGKVDDYGSARVRGTLQPFRATENTDLTVAFRNLEMNRLTPYSGKFAGRKIDSGKMSVDLEYKIKNRQLSGENKFVINTLKLGERVESPDAVNLPLDLAIALLEDSNGVIDLDLPISGNLDDPQFSYGKIVWKAIVNVIGKVATAPFRALGKLLGISADKLEAVAFDPGESTLLPPEQEKLKILADAMAKRPTLVLRVTPAFDASADKAALQEKATRRAVIQEMGLTLKEGEEPGPVDLNNIQTQTAVENLYKDLKGEPRRLKAMDAVRDYFRKPKPEEIPRYEEMLKALKDAARIPADALEALAKQRAGNIRNFMIDKNGLPPEKINLVEPDKVSGGKTVPLKLELGVAKAER